MNDVETQNFASLHHLLIMHEAIFLNGKFLSADAAKISVLEPGFLSGYGVFETMRSYNDRIVYLNGHLQRFKISADYAEIKLPYSLDKIKKIIHQAVKQGGGRDNYIRITAWKSINKEAGFLLMVRKYVSYPETKYRKGFKACIAGALCSQNKTSASIKTTSRLFYELEFNRAKKNNFDEAVILDNQGSICEGTRTNIFFVKDKEIFTPDLECGCLNGITRRVICDSAKKYKLNVYEEKFTTFDLGAADEAFLTNSLIGVMPLTELENSLLGNGKRGKITQFFIQEYSRLFVNG